MTTAPASRIAYIISAYKLPEQVVRLVCRLQTDTSSFFLHIDKKSDNSVVQYVSEHLRSQPNVYLLKRHTCYWGGFGHVAATLEGIRMLPEVGVKFDYLVVLTGQDYPIKSANYIGSFLSEHQGELFMESFPLPHHEWENDGMDRVRRWHLRVFQRHFWFPPPGSRMPLRVPPQGMRLFGGSSYWCITRECVEYISQFLGSHRDFVRFFKYVDVPDELFFQTIVMNSSFREAVIKDNLTYIDWKDSTAGSPALLTSADFPSLASSHKLFARKFDATTDLAILDMIDHDLLRVS